MPGLHTDGAVPGAGQRNWMAELGETLADEGYPVLPIIPGAKCPGQWSSGRLWYNYKGWERHCDRPTKPFEVDIWRRWPGCGIGVACGRIIGIDIDVLDAEAVERIEALARTDLGDTPAVRIGLAPKRLLVYRAERPFSPIKRHPIEVLARGSQFVAYATHPDTGEPYRWPLDELAELPLSSLPVVSEEQCRRFLDAAWEMVPPELRQSRLGPDRSADHYYAGGELRGTREAVAAALEHIPNDDLHYDDWIRIGLAIKGALGEEGLDLFAAWSARSAKDQPAYTLRTWKGLKPQRIGAGTLYYYATEQGWIPDHELILNGSLAQAVTAAPDAGRALVEKARAALQPAVAAEPAAVEPGAIGGGVRGLPVPKEIMAPGGVLGWLVDWMTATAVSPQPFLALGAAICAVGALAGHRYRTPFDNRTNTYVIALGASGSGKDHPRKCVRNAMLLAGLGHHLGGEELASGPAVMAALARQPAILFQVDEIGHFLQAVLDPNSRTPHRREIMAMLTKLWTSADGIVKGTEYANQKERPRVDIDQPCACLYGSTVPAELWRAMQSGSIGDGSIARFLIFHTPENYPDVNEAAVSAAEVPERILEGLKAVAQGAAAAGGNLKGKGSRSPWTVPLTAEAQAAWRTVQAEQLALKREHEESVLSAVWNRWAEHSIKLALIRAVSANPPEPEIDADDIAWGVALARHSIRTLELAVERYVADSQHEASLKRLLDAIRRQGGEIDGNALARRTQWLSRRDRNEMLMALAEAGMIELRKEQGSTKPRTVVRITQIPQENSRGEIEESTCEKPSSIKGLQ